MCRHAAVYALSSTAFIGLPCPKKIAGSTSAMRLSSTSLSREHTVRRAPRQRGHVTARRIIPSHEEQEVANEDRFSSGIATVADSGHLSAGFPDAGRLAGESSRRREGLRRIPYRDVRRSRLQRFHESEVGGALPQPRARHPRPLAGRAHDEGYRETY